jgi:hypothetical protein
MCRVRRRHASIKVLQCDAVAVGDEDDEWDGDEDDGDETNCILRCVAGTPRGEPDK